MKYFPQNLKIKPELEEIHPLLLDTSYICEFSPKIDNISVGASYVAPFYQCPSDSTDGRLWRMLSVFLQWHWNATHPAKCGMEMDFGALLRDQRPEKRVDCWLQQSYRSLVPLQCYSINANHNTGQTCTELTHALCRDCKQGMPKQDRGNNNKEKEAMAGRGPEGMLNV